MDSLVEFFAIQREIFGICPCCGEIFRLSDARIYLRARPRKNWMDLLEDQDQLLDQLEEQIGEAEEELRDKARKSGRRRAQRAIKRIDPVFAPRNLNADDAKVLFHPVDYVVFKGMKEPGFVDSIVLLDRETKDPGRRRLQRTIEKAVEKENYDWVTIRVGDDGKIATE